MATQTPMPGRVGAAAAVYVAALPATMRPPTPPEILCPPDQGAGCMRDYSPGRWARVKTKRAPIPRRARPARDWPPHPAPDEAQPDVCRLFELVVGFAHAKGLI